jgi:hypothetical protein
VLRETDPQTTIWELPLPEEAKRLPVSTDPSPLVRPHPCPPVLAVPSVPQLTTDSGRTRRRRW